MTLIVDASVAVKWVADEENAKAADALRSEGELIAPSLVGAEIGSALWRRVRQKLVVPADALRAMQVAVDAFDTLVPIETLHVRAMELALELNHPIYDCFYLALAERERAPIVSADARLLDAAKRMKGIEARKL